MTLSAKDREEVRAHLKAAGHKVVSSFERGYLSEEAKDRKLKTFRAMWEVLKEES